MLPKYNYIAYITFLDQEPYMVRSNTVRDLAKKLEVAPSTVITLLKTDAVHCRLARNLKISREPVNQVSQSQVPDAPSQQYAQDGTLNTWSS